MPGGRPPGTDLPAPYEDPWRRLVSDLRAVLATLRLRLWELGRRNRQGDLWRPSFWPEQAAAWFWPLLLALLLGGVVGTTLAVRASEPAPEAVDPGGAAAADSAPAAAPADVPGSDKPEPLVPHQPSLAIPPREIPAPETSPPQAAPGDADTMPPLLAAFADTPAAELLLEATADPALALLRLRVTPAFGELPEPLRRQRLEGWWQRAQELGYERLELRGSEEELLARTALVGAGLLLYELPAAGAGDPA
jgi:hypothetical protein